jgi:predicted nucleic-acid-binding Zn-ribbon protein
MKNDVCAFTKNSPRCPKCGGETRRRYHRHYDFEQDMEVLTDLPDGEYLIVHCQDCHYEFAQHVKK